MAQYHKKLRKHKRLKLEHSVNIDLIVDNEIVPSKLINISKGGAKIKTDRFIKPGSYVGVKFSLKNCINSIVKRVDKDQEKREYYFGLQFKEDWKGNIADLIENDVLIKRKFARRVPKGELYVDVWRDGHEASKQKVKIKDISEGGAKIITKIAWEKGSTLNLNFKDNYVIVGTVRWKSVIEDSNEILYVIGIQFIKSKDSEGILAIKKKIKNSPEVVSNHVVLADELKREGRFKEALNSYLTAISLDPKNEALLVNLAILYMDQNKLEKAITALENAIKIKPNFEIATMLLNKIKVMN